VKSTIVIPTYNRTRFLRRCLRHLVAQRCAHAVIIADGSREEDARENAEAAHEVSADLDIQHLVFPSELPFLTRCFEALRNVRTDTATFHADDDFLLIRALTESAGRLDEDRALVASQGQMILVQNTEAPHLARIHTGHTTPCESAEVSSRLTGWLANYYPLFYATTRTSALAHAFYEVAQLDPPAPRLTEIALCYFILVQGGVALTPGVFGVRESHPASTGRKEATWPDIVCGESFSPWFVRFRSHLVDFAAENGIAKGESLAEAVNQSFSKYLILALGGPRPSGRVEQTQRAFTLQLFSESQLHEHYYAELETVFSMMSGSL